MWRISYSNGFFIGGVIVAVTVACYVAFDFAAEDRSSFGMHIGDGIGILEPDSWVGQKLPLLPYVKLGEELDDGEWSLFLCRRNCTRSLRLLNSQDFRDHLKSERSRVAVLEIPSTADIAFPPLPSTVAFGKLDGRLAWFCETPSVIGLKDGIVQNVNGSQRSPQMPSPVTLSQEVINLGRVPLYGRRQVSLTVTNRSVNNIVVAAKSSCSCTITTLRSTGLSPNGSTTLDVLFAPRNADRVGARVEPVRIVPTVGGQSAAPQSVYLYVNVEPRIRVAPPRVDFGDVTELSLENARAALKIDTDSPAWSGLLTVRPADSLVVVPRSAGAGSKHGQVDVRVAANAFSNSENPVALAEVVHLNTVVDGEEIKMTIPVTGRLWKGGCFAAPATCYTGLLSPDSDSKVRFAVVDQRRAPEWESASVASDTLKIIGVQRHAVNLERAQFEITVRPLETQQTEHIIEVKLADRQGEECVVPVRLVTYLSQKEKSDD